MKTIKQVLSKAKIGDIFTNGKLYWKVIDTNFDGAVVACPITKTGKPSKSGFELWSTGIEEVAIIPGLRKVKND
jgi:hypothetical protein